MCSPNAKESAEAYAASGAPAWRWRSHCSLLAELAALDARVVLTTEPSPVEELARAERLGRH